MTRTVYNFNPGPATLPAPVLAQTQHELAGLRWHRYLYPGEPVTAVLSTSACTRKASPLPIRPRHNCSTTPLRLRGLTAPLSRMKRNARELAEAA